MTFLIIVFFAGLSNCILGNLPLTILTQDPHKGVFRSLQRGLQLYEVIYNINPQRIEDIHPNILVIDGLDKFRYALSLKKQGRIKHLLAGPNLMIRSCDYDHLLSAPELDMYLVPSDWTKIAYIQDELSLENRIAIWPAGVDTDYWKPTNKNNKNNRVIVYWKTDSEAFCQSVEHLLQSFGYEVTRITYGAYHQEQFKNELNNCDFAIFISRSESQGIALAEAWSMDVPTFVWNPGEFFYAGKQYNPVSACPFLTDAQGKDWRTIEQLKTIIINYRTNQYAFYPRKWTVEHMSDQVSVQRLLEIINQL